MFDLFKSGPRQLPPKPVSLSVLADRVLFAQQEYEQRLREMEADRLDAENKLTKKVAAFNPADYIDESTAAEMEAELKQNLSPLKWNLK